MLVSCGCVRAGGSFSLCGSAAVAVHSSFLFNLWAVVFAGGREICATPPEPQQHPVWWSFPYGNYLFFCFTTSIFCFLSYPLKNYQQFFFFEIAHFPFFFDSPRLSRVSLQSASEKERYVPLRFNLIAVLTSLFEWERQQQLKKKQVCTCTGQSTTIYVFFFCCLVIIVEWT